MLFTKLLQNLLHAVSSDAIIVTNKIGILYPFLDIILLLHVMAMDLLNRFYKIL